MLAGDSLATFMRWFDFIGRKATSRCWASLRACAGGMARPAISLICRARFFTCRKWRVPIPLGRFAAFWTSTWLPGWRCQYACAEARENEGNAACCRARRTHAALDGHLPKPLLKVAGKPLIEWHLEKLARAGFRESGDQSVVARRAGCECTG